jgi:hypothetical protein
MKQIPSPLEGAVAYQMGSCKILVSQELIKGRLWWHLSISHQTRYPTWQEIKEARYELIPEEATMAMLLPPKGEYVNLHENCFHLWEIEGEQRLIT